MWISEWASRRALPSEVARRRAVTRSRPEGRTGRLSWGCPLPRRISCATVSPHRFGDPSSSLRGPARRPATPDLEVFPTTSAPSSHGVWLRRFVLGVRAPLQSTTTRGGHASCMPAWRLSWVSWLLQHHRPVESTFPGLPRPVCSVSRVSHPPDGLLLDRLPAVFQAGALMEFHALQSLPPRPEPDHLSVAVALLPFPHTDA
jgi:hypothetical protein